MLSETELFIFISFAQCGQKVLPFLRTMKLFLLFIFITPPNKLFYLF